MYPAVINELDEYGDSQDPRVEHTVQRECYLCFYDGEREDGWIFNKNTGTMHIQMEDGNERTRCGKVATDPQWLWQQ